MTTNQKVTHHPIYCMIRNVSKEHYVNSKNMCVVCEGGLKWWIMLHLECLFQQFTHEVEISVLVCVFHGWYVRRWRVGFSLSASCQVIKQHFLWRCEPLKLRGERRSRLMSNTVSAFLTSSSCRRSAGFPARTSGRWKLEPRPLRTF